MSFKIVFNEYEYTYKPDCCNYDTMKFNHKVGEVFNIPRDACMLVWIMKFFLTGLVRHRKRLETYRIKTYNRYERENP